MINQAGSSKLKEVFLDKNDQKEVNLENLELSVTKIEDFEEEGIIGGRQTHITLKGPKSFMIGTDQAGFKLSNENKLIDSGKLPISDNTLRDIVYIPSINSYLLATNFSIYKKEIDKSPIKLFLDIKCGHIDRPGSFLRYSRFNQRLIVSQESRSISVINPKTKKIELEFKAILRDYDHIQDLRIFGVHEDRVAVLTVFGNLILFRLNSKVLRGLETRYEIELVNDTTKDEEPVSVTVCDKNRYIGVEIGIYDSPYICSRMLVFRIEDDHHLALKTSLDLFGEDIGCKYAFDCFGYLGSRFVIWVGLTTELDIIAQVYVYDIKRGVLEELVDKRVPHVEVDPYRFHRIENELYYTGNLAQLMRLGFKVNE